MIIPKVTRWSNIEHFPNVFNMGIKLKILQSTLHSTTLWPHCDLVFYVHLPTHIILFFFSGIGATGLEVETEEDDP